MRSGDVPVISGASPLWAFFFGVCYCLCRSFMDLLVRTDVPISFAALPAIYRNRRALDLCYPAEFMTRMELEMDHVNVCPRDDEC